MTDPMDTDSIIEKLACEQVEKILSNGIILRQQARIKVLEAQIEELHCGVTAAHFQGYIQGVQAAEAKLTGGKDE